MFTGLIDHCGVIEKIESINSALKIFIQSNFHDLTLGESIALDGACLTITEINGGIFSVDISSETLAKTTAKNYQLKDRINLERALKIGDRLGGHFVSGHVDQEGKIADIIRRDEFYEWVVTDLKPNLLIDKGSITINGVSLTVNKVVGNRCHLMLIPHTVDRTNLSSSKINDIVNIEYDLLAKIVTKQTEDTHHDTAI